jgi:hypothetical protein
MVGDRAGCLPTCPRVPGRVHCGSVSQTYGPPNAAEGAISCSLLPVSPF